MGVTLCISLTQADIHVTISDETNVFGRSLVINRARPVVITTESPAIFINFFPMSLQCFSLLEFLQDHDAKVVSPKFNEQDEWVRRFLDQRIEEPELAAAIMHLILSIDGYKPSKKQMDLRVLHIIKRICQTLPETLPIEHYAWEVGLSKDRLSHLFKENTGYTIKAYTLFEKARKAILYMVGGKSFTDSSMEAGFTDAAHFSNTVKKFYGLKLTDIASGMKITFYS